MTVPSPSSLRLSRRGLLAAAAVGLAVPEIVLRPAAATPADVAGVMKDVLKGRTPQEGRVKLELPALSENGNSVPLTIKVDSPMTATDRVTSIHVYAEENPLPNVAHFHLGPRIGRAQVATRIRLATTQRIIALAVMSDGSVWSGSGESLITIAACVDG